MPRRWMQHEFWPTFLWYLPLLPEWLSYAWKARSPFFFTVVNPGVPNGGMFNYSKSHLQNQLPSEVVPRTLFFAQGTAAQDVQDALSESGMAYPLIIKPDKGMRGWKVKKLDHYGDLQRYLPQAFDVLVQEYVDLPLEYGVFYMRYPDDEQKDTILNITGKKFLSVVGDGSSTLLDLMSKADRAESRLPILREDYSDRLSSILAEGEELLLEPIGNHNRGTMFVDRSELINDAVLAVFRLLSSHIDGFYWGRFDVRVSAEEDLITGDGLKVIEVNGALSEPTNMYDPKYSWRESNQILAHCMRQNFELAERMLALGSPRLSLWSFLREYRQHLRQKKKLST